MGSLIASFQLHGVVSQAIRVTGTLSSFGGSLPASKALSTLSTENNCEGVSSPH